MLTPKEHLDIIATEAIEQLVDDDTFRPRWPNGLEPLTFYEFPCDDKGRDGGCWLRVMVAGDGDVHVSMQEWENIRQEGSQPCPIPSVRCRTLFGGGRFQRTRQALLLLADAIRRDREELYGPGK